MSCRSEPVGDKKRAGASLDAPAPEWDQCYDPAPLPPQMRPDSQPKGCHEPVRHNRAVPAHEAVGQLVSAALKLGGDTDLRPYWQLAQGLRLKLTRHERQALAWAALMACDDDEAEGIAKSVLPFERRAGWPVTPLEDVASEASFWADLASPAELQAYAAVCLSRLSQRGRNAA